MAKTPAGTTVRESTIASALLLRQNMDRALVEITSGRHTVESALNVSADDAISRLYVVKVLESFVGIGKVRARYVLDELSISHKCQVENLKPFEISAISEKFSL